MLRQFTTASLVLCAAMLLVTANADDAASEEGKKKEFAAKCPVSGAKAKEDKSTAYKKAKVFFCCGKCKAAFEKDPKKHATKANAQLVATGQFEQKKCPFSGGPMKTKSKIAGVEVKFCCGKCKKAADEAEGDEQLALIFGEKAFEKGFAKKKKDKDAKEEKADKA